MFVMLRSKRRAMASIVIPKNENIFRTAVMISVHQSLNRR